MRRSTIVVVVTLALLSMAVPVIAQSSETLISNNVGTWKLNLAKSTYSPGPPPQSNTIKWEPWEGGFKTTIDVIDAQGQATHAELVGKFDGKDNPLKGAPAANTTRAYKRIDDRTYELVDKVDGKVTTTQRMVLSRDGKTRTFTVTGKNAQGQAVNNVIVYDRQ